MKGREERSAGGVVVRSKGTSWEVLLIKDMNGSWTFPKGLIENGEEPAATAKREAEEEVGIKDLRLRSELTPIHYMYYRNGLVRKTVHYFLFQAHGEPLLRPQKEEGISAAKWVPLPQALKIIGYPKTNKSLLEQAQRLLASKGHPYEANR